MQTSVPKPYDFWCESFKNIKNKQGVSEATKLETETHLKCKYSFLQLEIAKILSQLEDRDVFSKVASY